MQKNMQTQDRNKEPNNGFRSQEQEEQAKLNNLAEIYAHVDYALI